LPALFLECGGSTPPSPRFVGLGFSLSLFFIFRGSELQLRHSAANKTLFSGASWRHCALHHVPISYRRPARRGGLPAASLSLGVRTFVIPNPVAPPAASGHKDCREWR
jgi:hypothetical protein